MGEKSLQQIKIYTTTWCGDCKRTKSFLEDMDIEYQEISVEDDEDAMNEMKEINGGLNVVPTVVLKFEDDDEKILTEPSIQELKEALQI